MRDPWILVLSHEFPPLGGGAGKNAYLLCRELARRKVAVKVWTADPGPERRLRFDFPVEYLRTARRDRFDTHLRAMAAYVGKACLMGWRRRRERPALILAVLGIPAGLAGSLLHRVYGAPLAVWHHGSDVHGGRPQGAGMAQRCLLRRVWKRAAVNYFVGSGLRDRACAYGCPRAPRLLPSCPAPEILESGQGTGKHYGNAGASAAEGSVALPADLPFLFLGRFDPVKNPLLLIEAAARMKSAGTLSRRILMIGSGRLEADLGRALRRLGLESDVALEPAASFAAVPDRLRSAYALVLPSRIEGFNTTVLEAAGFGVPAVAADVAGLRDFVRDGDTGLLFPEGDAAALAAALRRLEDDPGLRAALGERARAAAAPYRIERVADAFLAGLSAATSAFSGFAREASPWN